MSDRISKKELIRRLARRMQTDEKTAMIWADAFTEVLYEAFKEGLSVTLPGFGGFFVRSGHGRAWTFKFNPGQKLRALFKWSSTYKGNL
ncbi:HU family DNA-binding protein [Desulfonema magnum]|uniref:DNA-binding domain-containing protein n=1 Tax=Desulfonema magnum TaxID=45655 RepID=A0A975GLG4_9BACT|nr:HU family DNA-binding protein [Desulfonema magnum]QTA84793.1 DNA-binding domain-containing protein [Desulfonema magnum]